MTLTIGIILLVAFAFYLFYVFREQPLDNVQRKPLRGTLGNGYEDTEFAEEYTFDPLKVDEDLESDFLPLSYGEERLVLMAKDPDWLYAYWEISEKVKNDFTEKVNNEAWFNSQPILRIYNLTQGDHFDINISDEADHWYIRIGKPNTKFKAEIARIYNGEYFSLLTSNQVTSPAYGFSEEIDPSWLPIPEIWQSLGSSFNPAFGSNHLTKQEH